MEGQLKPPGRRHPDAPDPPRLPDPPDLPDPPWPYWIRLFLMDAFGTTPRSARSCPLRRLPVLSHFSYSRNTSAFDAEEVRSLTSDRTSTKPKNFSASWAKSGGDG